MLAAEKSDFGVTGSDLLAETLVLDRNADGSYRLIGLKDRWTVGLKMLKTWHASGTIKACLVAVEVLQTLPLMFV